MESKILAQGAEAIITLDKNIVTKKRIKKNYRIKALDEKIRKLRTRSEGKLLKKAIKIANIPKVLKVDENLREIKLDFIEGKRLSENLNNFDLKTQKKICKQIGGDVSKIHGEDIIHGDLTTSNMILKEDKIYFIDFGLGFISRKFEDKAVDLHLLRQALEAKHFQNWKELWKKVLIGYSKSKDSKIIIERLKTVEKRGRYKH